MLIPCVIDNQTQKMTDVSAVQIKNLRKTFKRFLADGDITLFLEDVDRICCDTGTAYQTPMSGVTPAKMIKREDLRLICFDVISG